MKFSILVFIAIQLILIGQPPPPCQAQEAQPDSSVVGVLVWSMNIPGQVSMREGLEARAADFPVRLVLRVAGDGPAGIENQITQMNELVTMGVDLIIAQPADNAALTAPLRAANLAGIPVVAYDQYISGGRLTSYLTSDNYQAGFLDGEYVAAAFPDSLSLNIVLVEFPQVSSTVERVDGFMDALNEMEQQFTLAGSYEAVEPESGRLAGESILRDFPTPGSVDVIFTVNDGGGLAVVDVLAAAGRDEIFVASIDGDPASVQNIRDHRLTRIDSAQFCHQLGAEAMATSYRILQGEQVAAHILLPVFPVTRETLDLYHGWGGPRPTSFTKPWPSREPIWQWQLTLGPGEHP